MHCRLLDVLNQERRKRSKEAVGSRLAIHILDDNLAGKSELLHKFVAKLLRKLVLKHIAHKELAKNCTTTLIAKYVTQWRHIIHNLLAIVVARVGAGAKNARYARFIAAQCACSSKQVALHLYLLGRRNVTLYGIAHIVAHILK